MITFPVVTSSNSKSSQEFEVLQVSKTLLQKKEHCGQFHNVAFGYHLMEGQKLWVCAFVQTASWNVEKISNQKANTADFWQAEVQHTEI